MSIFKHHDSANSPNSQAEMVLRTIHDGVIITDSSGVVQFINPAAVRMTECKSADNATGLDYGLLIKLESKEGRELSDTENLLTQAIRTGQALDGYQACIIAGQSGKRIPVAISVLSADGKGQHRIITLRDITKELAEEGEQTEFISTASHEMRTPVATIDGYIALALNPQTATIDERARGYLTAAHAASQHLGKLFRDLLDATKLDDAKVRPHFVPVDMVAAVKSIVQDYLPRAEASKVKLTYGSDSNNSNTRRMEQAVYSYVDINFIREIVDNLIDNALKYPPAGGSIYINIRGDGDRALINVTDTGIGISAEDLAHIFQKFYRADNSDTRTIGGTGLGLYLVKQRAEAMGGRVWAESSFGEGSTFYVSLPRLSSDEYDKRMIAVHNQAQLQQQQPPRPAQALPTQQPLPPQPVQAQPMQPQTSLLPAPAPSQAPQPQFQPRPQPQPQQPTNIPHPVAAPQPHPIASQPPQQSPRQPIPQSPQLAQPRAPTGRPAYPTPQVNNNIKEQQ